MKTILQAYDLWDIVENGVPKSADLPAFPQSSGSSTISLNESLKSDADALFSRKVK